MCGSEREGGSLGRRKARWVPDTHCPRRLLLRDETRRAREEEGQEREGEGLGERERESERGTSG